jgi:hypothetical protein
MNSEILLVKERNGYRVMYGHNQLNEVLKVTNEVFVDVKWEQGKAKVFRTASGLLVAKDSRHLPLLNF